MATYKDRAPFFWPNGLTLLLGIWLFISPWVLAGPASGAWAWNSWIIAVVVVVLSVAALVQLAQWEEWVNLVLGGWLFFSPWFFGYEAMTAASWNAYIVGALIALTSIWGAVTAKSVSHETAHESR